MKGRCGTSVLLAGLVASCGGAGTSGAEDFADLTWTAEGPEVRIGAVDDPDYAFQSVRGLAVGPGGHVFSLHFNEAAIRRWTPDGMPAGTVGREGQGPGEFQRPAALGFFGDSLWVLDTRTYRVSYFRADGAFLGSVAPPVDLGSPDGGPVSPARPDQPFRDGTLLGRSPGWSEDIALGTLTETPVVRMDPEGSSTPLWSHPYEPHDVMALLNEDGRGGTFMSQPFGDGWLPLATGDGLVVVDRRAFGGEGEATFGLTRIGLRGDTLWSQRVPYAQEVLRSERVDSTVASMVEGMYAFLERVGRAASRQEASGLIGNAMYTPAYLPPIRSAVLADDGSIWLERFTSRDDGAVEWWIFGANGEQRGRALVPASVTLHAIHGDDLWGVETDDLDVNYIVRYRLVRGE